MKQHEIPLIEATTASLEALQAYSAAQAVNISKGSGAAIPLFKQAVDLDPSFALASAHLGRSYGNVGERALAADSIKKAYELRNRASDPEKFFISINYEQDVTGNLEKATEIAESWAQTYPRDVRAHTFLSIGLRSTGRYEASLEETSKAIAVDPDSAFGYVSQALDYVILDHPEKANETIAAAWDRKLQPAQLILIRYCTAFLSGDTSTMEQQVKLAQNRPDTNDWITHGRALVAAYSGRLPQARELSNSAVALAQAAENHERAATFEGAAAIYESRLGDPSKARERAQAALKLSNGRDVEFAVAFALAQLPDTDQSQNLASELNRRFPQDTVVQSQYLPVLHALAALRDGHLEKAEEALASAERYELTVNPLSINSFYGALYPVYVRGEVFLKEGRGAEAAAEFQKIIAHRGIMLADPIAAMARREIGRAWHLAGNDTKAKTAYQDFLSLWNNADELPILKQAKAEYAKLH